MNVIEVKERNLYLGFGSNIGDGTHLVTRAIKEVAGNPHIAYVKQSSFWLTEPLYDRQQPDFVNAAALYRSDLQPYALLEFLQLIEKQFLRKRDPQRPKGPRTMDIDIIFYGDIILNSPGLTIPHPHFHERKFILFPMAEIDVNYIVPGTSLSIAEYIQRCPDKSKVERL
jgi:2-amino-4-hydroxy-6-hydroxymethyldihydropteridine diphosphokinase